MTKRIILISILLVFALPACGRAPSELASEPPLEPSPTEIGVAILPPPSATYTPIPPSPPSPTATQVVVTEATEIAQASEPEPVATPTETPSPEPTASPTPTPEPDWLSTYGRTTDNRVYLGNLNAPVVLLDFSDFM